jgi:hypothetical protein
MKYYLLLRYVDFRLMREVYLSELHERSADRLSLITYATYNLVAHGLNAASGAISLGRARRVQRAERLYARLIRSSA